MHLVLEFIVSLSNYWTASFTATLTHKHSFVKRHNFRWHGRKCRLLITRHIHALNCFVDSILVNKERGSAFSKTEQTNRRFFYLLNHDRFIWNIFSVKSLTSSRASRPAEKAWRDFESWTLAIISLHSFVNSFRSTQSLLAKIFWFPLKRRKYVSQTFFYGELPTVTRRAITLAKPSLRDVLSRIVITSFR